MRGGHVTGLVAIKQGAYFVDWWGETEVGWTWRRRRSE